MNYSHGYAQIYVYPKCVQLFFSGREQTISWKEKWEEEKAVLQWKYLVVVLKNRRGLLPSVGFLLLPLHSSFQLQVGHRSAPLVPSKPRLLGKIQMLGNLSNFCRIVVNILEPQFGPCSSVLTPISHLCIHVDSYFRPTNSSNRSSCIFILVSLQKRANCCRLVRSERCRGM